MSARNKRLFIEDLTVSFDGFKALNKLTLYVEPGEMLPCPPLAAMKTFSVLSDQLQNWQERG